MIKKSLIILILLLSANSLLADVSSISPQWEYALAHENDSIINAQSYHYRFLPDLSKLEQFVPGGVGYIWVKGEFSYYPKADDKLSIFIPPINPTDETYLNGTYLGKSGIAQISNSYYFSDWNSVRKYNIPQNILQIQNEIYIKIFVYHEGSFSKNFSIGDEYNINKKYVFYDFLRTWINIIVLSILIFIAALNAMIFFQRREDKFHLYYTFMCVFSIIYQTNFIITRVPFGIYGEISYLVFQKVVFGSIGFAALFGIYMILDIFKIKKKRLISLLNLIFILLPVFALLLIPDYKIFFMMRKIVANIFSIYSIIVTLTILIDNLHKKNEFVKLVLFGFFPFMFCLIFDLLFHNILRIDNYIYLTFIGFPSILITFAFLLSINIVKIGKKLESMNEFLDKKVEDRTKELMLMNDKLHQLSMQDPLTGIYNRRSFMEIFSREFELAVRHKSKLSFLILDIDFFKKINDNYGHLAGDKVIIDFAELLKNLIRKSDMVARYGGEEFCILLPQIDEESALQVSEKIRNGVESLLIVYQGNRIQFTCSIGITELNKNDKNMTDLISRADQALYQAKETGRNKSIIYVKADDAS